MAPRAAGRRASGAPTADIAVRVTVVRVRREETQAIVLFVFADPRAVRIHHKFCVFVDWAPSA
jgi:hypothetical protein